MIGLNYILKIWTPEQHKLFTTKAFQLIFFCCVLCLLGRIVAPCEILFLCVNLRRGRRSNAIT